MRPAVIDLTTSPEPDESPGKAAASALRGFQPRKQKAALPTDGANAIQDKGSPRSAARTVLQGSQPRKQKSTFDPSSNSTNTTFGAFEPLLPDVTPTEARNRGSHKNHVRSNGTERRVLSHVDGRAASGQTTARDIEHLDLTPAQDGSLASLLQAYASNGLKRGDIGSALQQPQSPYLLNDISRAARIRTSSESDPRQWNHRESHARNSNGQCHIPTTRLEPSEAATTPRRPTTSRPSDDPVDVSDPARDKAEPRPVSRRVAHSNGNENPRPLKRQRTGSSDFPQNGSAAADQILHGVVDLLESRPLDSVDDQALRRRSTGMTKTSKAMLPAAMKRQPLPSAKTAAGKAAESPALIDLLSESSNGKRIPNGVPGGNVKADMTSFLQPDTSRRGRVSMDEHVDLPAVKPKPKPKPSMPSFASVVGGSKNPEASGHQRGSQASVIATTRQHPSVVVGPPRLSASTPQIQTSTKLGVARAEHIRGRTQPELRSEPQEVREENCAKRTDRPPPVAAPTSDEANGTPSNHGSPYTPDEDALLVRLKEVDKLNWDDITLHFKGRTRFSLQFRYSSKLKNRSQQTTQTKTLRKHSTARPDDTSEEETARRPQRQRRNNQVSVTAGFVSWTDVRKKRLIDDNEPSSQLEEPLQNPSARLTKFTRERANPKSISRILRQREFGSNSGRSWATTTRSVPEELKEQIFDDMGPIRYFQGTSGDVTSLTWAPNGLRFAAGSIALTDDRSMQYNKSCNLLLGDYERALLRELPDHHVPRPTVDSGSGNVNGLHSMRQTQDPRLFMTVANVQFSPDSSVLYSAGSDCKVRAYEYDRGPEHASCVYEIEHPAPLDLLSVSNVSTLATACHQAADGSVSVYRGKTKMMSLSPSHQDKQTERAVFPSALRWGTAAQHTNLLLAGFSIDSIDEERNIAGETCLWDVRAESRLELNAVTRNVFDVAWNPFPTSTSSVFAVASTPGTNRVHKGMRSVITCFAPSQNRASRVLEWECPAFDINDVLYCQHDDNLIAAGATDGKVYVWDQRFADSSHKPLHILAHDASLSVLDHDREREIADTGVRFLSWGATSSRLYSGSSDGVVKMWNPYRATENAHVKNIATFTSAIMSGGFSPDMTQLIIGEDQGRINLLSIGHADKTVRSMDRFELLSAPAPAATPNKSENRYSAAHDLVRANKVCFRPMGALPMRQAVQGPDYDGPFLAPSMNEIKMAEKVYDDALNGQNVAHLGASMSFTQGTDTEQAIKDADKRVLEAQESVLRLSTRAEDARSLRPGAEATQQRFRRAEKGRLKLEAAMSQPVEHCKLDCNYLPSNVDDAVNAPDSLRSQARIPWALRRSPDLDFLNMTSDELVDAGLTSRCFTCLRPAAPAKLSKQPTCERCYRSRNLLTAACEICSGPIRMSSKVPDTQLCERCNFACFRCGRPTLIARSANSITCDRCGLTWMTGVLGYELVKESTVRRTSRLENTVNHQTSSSSEMLEHVGDSELEHYASRWQTMQ